MRWPSWSIVCLALMAMEAALVARYATLDLGSDDVVWLSGGSPTVFDQYRALPRLFFQALHALVGPSAIAALAMSFFFHCVNGLLVNRVAHLLTRNLMASRVAAGIFLVNPLTLFALTWISCFSYVLGATLGLLSVWAFLTSLSSQRGSLWLSLSIATYAGALACCHDLLFLPVALLALAWIPGTRHHWGRLSIFLCMSALAGAAVYQFHFRFEGYGLQPGKLLHWHFASALVSSLLSYDLALLLAYPLSFAMPASGFLRVCFEEPGRWVLTVLVTALLIAACRSQRDLRRVAAGCLALAALTAPYVIRLYLMPDTASYHISYVLSGRVFYIPFLGLSVVLGALAAARWRALVWLAPVAFVAALFAYQRAEFLGLQVVAGRPAPEPTWTPYHGPATAWPLVWASFAAYFLLRRLKPVTAKEAA